MLSYNICLIYKKTAWPSLDDMKLKVKEAKKEDEVKKMLIYTKKFCDQQWPVKLTEGLTWPILQINTLILFTGSGQKEDNRVVLFRGWDQVEQKALNNKRMSGMIDPKRLNLAACLQMQLLPRCSYSWNLDVPGITELWNSCSWSCRYFKTKRDRWKNIQNISLNWDKRSAILDFLIINLQLFKTIKEGGSA